VPIYNKTLVEEFAKSFKVDLGTGQDVRGGERSVLGREMQCVRQRQPLFVSAAIFVFRPAGGNIEALQAIYDVRALSL
jgi:hypothetical protein